MISKSPLTPVQKAIFALLSGDAPLAELLAPPGIYDQVPENAQKPYVRIGDHLSIPDNAHGKFGRNITSTLHVWTEARGNVDGQEIADRLVELLDRQDRVLSGLIEQQGEPHRIVLIKHEFDHALRDPNPRIRHHIVRFRIKTEQTGD